MEDTTMNIVDIELRLLAAAYFWADYSILHQFVVKNSPVWNALQAGDETALRAFVDRVDMDLTELPDDKQVEFDGIIQKITDSYSADLKKDTHQIPDDYFEQLATRAVELGNYTTAHSAYSAIKKLDKYVNKYIVKGVELLQSSAARVESGTADIAQTIQQAAEYFYCATRIKNPLGHQFQYAVENLHLKDQDSFRKYFKYIEAALQKELIDFGIQFLLDDKAIGARVIDTIPNAKTRRLMLRTLAQMFSRGPASYAEFVQRYKQALELFKNADSEDQYLHVQRTMLGRGTGDNEYYQFLRELAVDHPISSLLVTIIATPENNTFLVPILMKSGQSLFEFLELDVLDS